MKKNTLVFPFEGPVNELGDIQDFERNLIPSHIGHHRANALLTGGDHRLGTGTQDLVDLFSGDLGGKELPPGSAASHFSNRPFAACLTPHGFLTQSLGRCGVIGGDNPATVAETHHSRGCLTRVETACGRGGRATMRRSEPQSHSELSAASKVSFGDSVVCSW